MKTPIKTSTVTALLIASLLMGSGPGAAGRDLSPGEAGPALEVGVTLCTAHQDPGLAPGHKIQILVYRPYRIGCN